MGRVVGGGIRIGNSCGGFMSMMAKPIQYCKVKNKNKKNKKGWMLKNWCFWTVVLEKTLERHLDSKEYKPVNPIRNKPWIFICRTDAEAKALILWPPDVKSWLIGKDPDAGKDWGQETSAKTSIYFKRAGWVCVSFVFGETCQSSMQKKQNSVELVFHKENENTVIYISKWVFL